jgi:hypothetical protein
VRTHKVLFPPLSCLEVMGEPRVDGGVIVVPLRVNMCLKGFTLEQLEQRRKQACIHLQHTQARSPHRCSF